MKNQRFVHEFVLLLLLAVAIGAIAWQSNLNFTGYVTLAECNGEDWVCGDWTTCTDSSQTRECNSTTTTTCTSPYTQTQSCTLPVCDANHLELCLDLATCTTATGHWYGTPAVCNPIAEPVCGDAIINGNEVCDGTQLNAQTCITQNFDAGTLACNADCLTFNTAGCTEFICDSSHVELCLDESTCTIATGHWYGTPAVCNPVTQPICDSDNLDLCVEANCSTSASGFWYGDECNPEAEQTNDDEEDEPDATVPSTTVVSSTPATAAESSSAISSCTAVWACGDWQECIGGSQARVCTDANTCGTQDGMPETSQACVVPIVETCSDGIKNQDETRVDCGGVCKKCGFFDSIGLSGSVINGPINKVKEIFANKTNVFIASGVLVLVIGGVICFKVMKKKRKKQN